MSSHRAGTAARAILKGLGQACLGLVEYGPLVLTVVLATYVGLSPTDPAEAPSALLQWVVVLLGLIATSLLVERVTRIRRIDDKISQVATLFAAFMSERIRATDFFLENRPNMRQEIESASTVLVVAVNAESFLVEYKNSIAEMVREGGSLRVIAVDPSSSAAELIANPAKQLTVDYLKATAQIAKQTLLWINGQCAGKGSVELRYCDHVPVFGAHAFDWKSPRGKIVFGLYRQIWTHDRRPHGILTRNRDGYWYTFFEEQLDEIWGRGTAVPLTDAAVNRLPAVDSGAHQNAKEPVADQRR